MTRNEKHRIEDNATPTGYAAHKSNYQNKTHALPAVQAVEKIA